MTQTLVKNEIYAGLDGRDSIEITTNATGEAIIHFVGCEEFANMILQYKSTFGENPKLWPIPESESHAGLVLKEFILKLKNQWNIVYPHDEICHCRFVKIRTVEQAILAGARTSEQVSRWTSASTACGTCRPDVEAILTERLRKI